MNKWRTAYVYLCAAALGGTAYVVYDRFLKPKCENKFEEVCCAVGVTGAATAVGNQILIQQAIFDACDQAAKVATEVVTES